MEAIQPLSSLDHVTDNFIQTLAFSKPGSQYAILNTSVQTLYIDEDIKARSERSLKTSSSIAVQRKMCRHSEHFCERFKLLSVRYGPLFIQSSRISITGAALRVLVDFFHMESTCIVKR